MPNETKQLPALLSVTETAEYLGLSEQTVRSCLQRGEIPGIQIRGRGRWYVHAARLAEYLEPSFVADAASIQRSAASGADSGAPGSASVESAPASLAPALVGGAR
jgi:excisionase family DNA binding protein